MGVKHHNGVRRVNKLDGGKKGAKKQFHKKLREANNTHRSDAVKEFLGPTLEDHFDSTIGHKHGLDYFEFPDDER